MRNLLASTRWILLRLLATIHDVLLRVNVSITKLRGQCYDGASSMSGSRGVAIQLQKEPRAVYTYCYGHALNLTCNDAVKNCKIMRRTGYNL